MRSALEGAEDKQAIPGASALLRELRAGGGARICIISGSPRQMRRVLAEKLALDGVEFDEFILKHNLRNMLRGRFRALREQVGYKLPALLAGRAGLPPETRETCFGDDAEADAFIYSLYADIIAGRVERAPARGDPRARRRLRRRRAARGHARRGAADRRGGARASSSTSIGARRRRASTATAPRLVPVFNYFQAALVLFEDGQLSAPAVVRVALEMVDRFGYTIDALRNSLQDLLRRGRLLRATARTLADELTDDKVPQLGALPSARELLISFAARVRQLGDVPSLAMPLEQPIDYLAALEADLPRKGKKRTDIAPPIA